MAFINVAEWSPQNVVNWLQGLEDSILPYVAFFLNNNINGCRLLLLSCDDLDNLNVTKVGHQEIILEAVELLKHLHYNFCSETLQMLALRLGCKSRSLFNMLKQETAPLETIPSNQQFESHDNQHYQHNIHFHHDKTGSTNEKHHNLINSKKPDRVSGKSDDKLMLNDKQQQITTINKSRDRVSTKTLSGVCNILNSVKSFISWIDRYPLSDGSDERYSSVRKQILKISIELVSTAQRDQFVEKPNEVIKKNCAIFAEMCDKIVQELNDPLAIQPASLEVVTIKKKPEDELGIHLYSSYSGIHIIGGVKLQSPSHRCSRLEEGDEIVQVNYQTVVGWQLPKLSAYIAKYPTEVILTVKKRPRHSNVQGQITVLRPYNIVPRKVKSSGNRTRNAATATRDVSDNESDQGSLKERSSLERNKPMKSPINHVAPRRPRVTFRRRASISGSSPTAIFPPVRIEDLVDRKDFMILARTVSTDDNTKQSTLSRLTARNRQGSTETVASTVSCETCCSNISSGQQHSVSGKLIPPQKSSSTSQVPYAKVHPLFNREENYGCHIAQPQSPHYVTPPPPIPAQRQSQQHQHKQSLQHLQQTSTKPISMQPKQLVTQTSLPSQDNSNDPEFHEYQPPPSPKLPPSPPKTPPTPKSPPPPPPPPPMKLKLLDASHAHRLNNVTLPRRKTSDSQLNQRAQHDTLTRSTSTTTARSTPQPPPPRVVGVARSTQTSKVDINKLRRSPTLSDSSADYSKSGESENGEEIKLLDANLKKTKPVVPRKSLKVQQLMVKGSFVA